MTFISEEIERYIDEHSTAEPKDFTNLRREAFVHLLQPRMLSGHVQGQLLRMLVTIAKPHNILEIGTYSGYTTLVLAKALDEVCCTTSKVYTIEACDEREDFIRQSIDKLQLSHRIELIIDKAEHVLPTLVTQHYFDFIYIDANKRHYSNYYKTIIDHLPSGAIIIADNTLWDGKVIATTKQTDAQTKGILTFNTLVASDPRIETVILPLRDGLTLMLKR